VIYSKCKTVIAGCVFVLSETQYLRNIRWSANQQTSCKK